MMFRDGRYYCGQYINCLALNQNHLAQNLTAMWPFKVTGQNPLIAATVQVHSHQTAFVFELSSHSKIYIIHTIVLQYGPLTHGPIMCDHGDFDSQLPFVNGFLDIEIIS